VVGAENVGEDEDMNDEQNRENVFRWQEWLLEGFQGLIQGVQA